MSAELKRAKREKELKHKRDKLTLDEIREEIAQQEKQLEDLKNQKDRLFAEFKKVLTEDEARKNMQRAREAAFNHITFSTPNSADLPKPYQSAIVTVANTPVAPSTISSVPHPTHSLNGQQLYYQSHLQQLSTPNKIQQQQQQQQQRQTLTGSPNASLQLRRDPTPQSHMSTPPNSNPMLLSQPSHLQQQQQQPQPHQTQPLMLSKQTPPSHHPSMPLHLGFSGIIPHPQQSSQSFVNQNISDRGRVSITGKRSHEQSNSISQQQAPPPQPQILSGPNSFLSRGAPSSLIPPGALHGHPNGKVTFFLFSYKAQNINKILLLFYISKYIFFHMILY